MVLTAVMCCEHRRWRMAPLLHVYLSTSMFALMVALSLTILLVLLLLGLVFLLTFLGYVVGGRIWTCYPFHAELGVERCSLYSSLPGPLKPVQRAEMCG